MRLVNPRWREIARTNVTLPQLCLPVGTPTPAHARAPSIGATPPRPRRMHEPGDPTHGRRVGRPALSGLEADGGAGTTSAARPLATPTSEGRGQGHREEGKPRGARASARLLSEPVMLSRILTSDGGGNLYHALIERGALKRATSHTAIACSAPPCLAHPSADLSRMIPSSAACSAQPRSPGLHTLADPM